MQAVILTAGQSSRFWPLNQKHKALIKIMGKPLIWHTLESLSRTKIKDVIIIQSPKKEIEQELENYKFKGLRIRYVVQQKPIGSGNALCQVKDFLTGRFLVLNAERLDIDEIIKTVPKAPLVLFGQKTNTPEIFGIARMKGNKILEIIEKPKKGKAPSDIKIVGVYLLELGFFEAYKQVKKGMYDFEATLSLLMKKEEAEIVILKKKEKDTPSLKYPWHLFAMEKYLFNRFLKAGVAKTAHIAKSATIEGKVHIAENVRVYENAVIKGPCYIGANCIIGNNAIVREYTDLEEGTLIGANAEAARTIFQPGVHTHSGYFGDSIFAQDCRLAAGTVTANIRIDRGEIKTIIKGKKIGTGLNKLGVIMGQNSKTGINVSLMPGVLIGGNVGIGAGSLIMENIKDNMVVYSESKLKKFTK
ncbi:NTP transferase domain-containing protein [Candidatus Parcubacteria bacterium]|nr:NTP transferase domain-containing protein [Candidatus Parcubacteria bacterium]